MNRTTRRGLGAIGSVAAGVLLTSSAWASNRTTTELGAVSERSGVVLQKLNQASSPDIKEKTQSLLENPLTPEAAVQLAALNNRRLQVLLQESDMALADRRQGRTLPNPEVETSFRRAGDERHTEVAVFEDINGLLFYPWKRGQANARYGQAQMQLADAFVGLIADVKKGYFQLQALLHQRALRQSVVESAEAASELALRQKAAGNINALDLATHEALLHEAQLALMLAESEALGERERVAVLLGLESSEEWRLPEALPDLPEADPVLPDLERTALDNRPLLAAAREGALASERGLTLAKLGFFPSLKAGPFFEKDQEGRWLKGPAVAIEVPLFDFGSSARKRARAERDRSHSELAALRSEVISEVRAVHQRMSAAREAVQRYRSEVLPLRERVVFETQRQYNFMLAGVYQLIAAKQSQTAAERDYIGVLRDYWVARADLERAVGGALP